MISLLCPIISDLARVLPETVLPESKIDDIFGGPMEPLNRTLISDAIERKMGIYIPWADAIRWATVQDIIDYLEAREAEGRG